MTPILDKPSARSIIGAVGRFRVEYRGEPLELSTRREGLRTRVTLWRGGREAGEASGFGRTLLPLDPDAEARDGEVLRGPTVLVLSALPGVVNRAMLLVARAEGDEAPGPPAAVVDDVLAALPRGMSKLAGLAAVQRYPFAPPAGSFAARLAAFATAYPRLWAARHVVLAAAKVAVGLLGLALFVQALLRPVVTWLTGLLPDWRLDIPWPDIDLPDIPLPDIDLPDLVAPGWLLVLVATAKFWGPVLVAVVIAVVEVRRRRRRAAADDHAPAGRADP